MTDPGPGATVAAPAIPEPGSEAVAVESGSASSTLEDGEDWPQLVVLLTAALLYAADRVAQLDQRRPPGSHDVQRWLVNKLPVGASPLFGHEARARQVAEQYASDRPALLGAYRLKAERGGLRASRGSPAGLLRWWLKTGVAEAVDGARHAAALRRASAGSANCNAAWERAGPVEPMAFDPDWEVRP